MSNISQEILDLNSRVSKANDRKIRLQTRRETLQINLDSLVDEIEAAGYKPATLKADRERLEQELESRKIELETQLAAAEKQLDSIPE